MRTGTTAGSPAALIGDVARGSVHDGPGLRTTVFFKGCPLRCLWCHNPELIRFPPEVSFSADRCLACGDCVRTCPEDAASLDRPGRVDRLLCTGCGACADACPAAALRRIGTEWTVDALVACLLRDRPYFEASGGGVTLSGGEPLAWPVFVRALLGRLKAEGIHTVLETSGAAPWPVLASVLGDLDLILFDVKAADPGLHRRLTGAGNRRILANLRRLLAARPTGVVVRVPLIPGFTATPDNLRAIRRLLRDVGARRVEVLPWNPYGLSKAASLGRPIDPRLPDTPMSAEEAAALAGRFAL